MNNTRDFTVNSTAFPDLANYVKGLQAKGQKVIPIIDPTLVADDLTDKFYRQANDNGTLIKSSINPGGTFNGNLVSSVFNKHNVFMDFMHDKSFGVW